MPGRSGTFHNLSHTQLLAPAVRTASANSASFDTAPFDSVSFVVGVGATGDTLNGTNRVELSLQESDDNATFTPVADADMAKVVAGGQAAGTFGLVNNASTAINTVYRTAYLGYKRYVRVALTNFGTTSSGTGMNVMAVAGRARNLPINT